MSAFRTEDDVREWLAKKLGLEPRGDIWDELVERGYARDVMEAECEADRKEVQQILFDYYKEQDMRYPVERPAKGSRRIQRKGSADERLEYLAKLVAADVKEDPRVVRFRRVALGGRLLEMGEVKDWISARAEEEGESMCFTDSVAMTIPDVSDLLMSRLFPIPDSHRDERILACLRRAITPLPWQDQPTSRSRQVFLTCRLEDDVVVQPIAFGGTLHNLYDVGQHISSEYGWAEGDATAFVLTGWAPVVFLYDLELVQKAHFPALDAVQLRFPFRLSPRDVAAFYAEERKWLEQGLGVHVSGRRDRPMSRKHLELAVFYRTHQHGTLAHRMGTWNKEHPDWRYDQVTNFGRDLRSAYTRLTERMLPKKRGSTGGGEELRHAHS